MQNNKINPEKITKPIQVLAAWLVGLFSIDSCFLIGAGNFEPGSHESLVLVWAAIVNVPLFLIAVFLLQTKFRPELQEDSYYSTYLSQKTNQKIKVSRSEVQFMELSQKLSSIEARIGEVEKNKRNNTQELEGLIIGINSHLSDFSDIKQSLAKHGFMGFSSFAGDDPPENRTVAISHNVSEATTKHILKLAKEVGFRHYSRFDNWAEETKEDVLFGSYGTPGFEII